MPVSTIIALFTNGPALGGQAFSIHATPRHFGTQPSQYATAGYDNT